MTTDPLLRGSTSTDFSVNLRKRYEACKSQRSTVEQTWEEIERYIMPWRGMFFKDERSEHTIEWRKRFIFDGTAPQAQSTLSASIHSALTSFTSKWFGIRFRNHKLNKNTEAKKWLEVVSDDMFYTLDESDFELEINEAYTDLTGFGIAHLSEEEKMIGESHAGLDFKSMSIKHSFFEEDAEGRTLFFYFRINWTATQIIDKFGKENVPEDIVQKAEAGTTDEKEELVYAIYPRENYQMIDTSATLGPMNRPWGGMYFLTKDASVLDDNYGYYEMPVFSPRWRKTNDSKFGNSPGMLVLSDIITLNDLIELTLANLGKVVDPPFFVTPRGLLSDLDLQASGLTVIQHKDDIWQFESKGRFDAGELRIQDLRETINRAFMVDQLELKESPAMSATEANIRYELMQRLLGPTLGRLKSELYDPMIQRTYRIRARAGAFEPPPQIVQDAEAEFDIEYLGPLPKAQRAQTALAVERWFDKGIQLGQVAPEVLQVPDWQTAYRDYGDMLGVPAKYMADEDDAKNKAEAQEEAARDAQQAETASTGADAMQKMSGVGEDNVTRLAEAGEAGELDTATG